MVSPKEGYIDRETIAVMNSPHAFQYGFIDDLYNEAIYPLKKYNSTYILYLANEEWMDRVTSGAYQQYYAEMYKNRQ